MNAAIMENMKIEVRGEYIRNILINRDIDCDEQWWEEREARTEIKELVNAETYKLSNSVKMKIESEEKFVFLAYKECIDRDRLLSEIVAEVDEMAQGCEEPLGCVHLVCFVTNMKNRIFLEKIFASEEGKKMKKQVRSITGNKRDRINCTYILDQEFKKQDIKLVNVNRYELIQMPPIRSHINWEVDAAGKKGRKGYVLSVELRQLVEIYDKVGDRLFSRNVRYGLSEQLGVDQAIKDTLEHNPEQFWFKNNGVTIMVERRDFKLDRVGEILIEGLKEYGNLQFSVINGAQTITAAAEYFYGLEYELSEAETEEDKKKIREKINRLQEAKVLLRIIHIPLDNGKEETKIKGSREVSEISVALNRQKPIKAEDIAFASPFVEKLTEFLDQERKTGNAGFRLVKRGEDSKFEHSINLVEFARARKACCREPGAARSQGTNTLLSFENVMYGEYQFKNKDIFPEEWMDADSSNEAEIFRKYYGAVDFAVKTSRLYEKLQKDLNFTDLKRQIVIQNGKWYFTAYIVLLLNFFSTDYSEFVDHFDAVSGCMTELMELFAGQAAELSNDYLEDEHEFNSNLFKKNEFFNYIVNEADWSGFEKLINDHLKTGEISFRGPSASQGKKLLNLKVRRVKLGNNSSEVVESTADAMVKTVEFILMNHSYDDSEVTVWCGGWLSDDEAAVNLNAGYFRRNKKIEVNGNTYWVGTSSNSRRKYDQIEELCRLVGVEHGTIKWYSNIQKSPIFEW